MMNIGVYKISNKSNSKFYIGSSVNLKKRLRDHLFMLRANKHNNIYLQRSFNKYGEENFEFEVICYAEDLKDAREKEQYYIDSLDACNTGKGFNVHPIAVGGSVKGELSNNFGNKGLNNPMSKQICQVDTETREVIKIWGSLREAESAIGINITHVSKICEFLKTDNFLKVSKGFFWCYERDLEMLNDAKVFTFKDRKKVMDHSNKIRKGKDNGMSKRVVKFSKDKKVLSKYDSVSQAAKDSYVNPQIIYNQLFRKPKNPRGDYLWAYEE